MKRIFTLLLLMMFGYGYSQTLVTRGVGTVTNTTAKINFVLQVPAAETYTSYVYYSLAPNDPRTNFINVVQGPNITANPGVTATSVDITGLTANTNYNYTVLVQRALPSSGSLLYYANGSFTTRLSATPPMPTPLYHFPFNGSLASSDNAITLTSSTTPTGTPTYVSNGITNNSAVRVNTNTNLVGIIGTLTNLPQGIDSRTVSLRMAYTSTAATNYVFSWGAANNNQAFGYIQTNATTGSALVYGSNDVSFTNNVTNNTWFTLIMTYDGINIRIYKDGALISTTARGLNTIGTAFKIGLDVGGFRALLADIDDVRIYGSALTATEVTTLHQTLTATAPTISAVSASNITATGATINYTLNANNQNTTSTIQYGTTSTNLNLTATGGTASGNTNTALTTSLTGLSTNVKYYYRVVAVNAAGTTTDDIDSFTTAQPLPLITVNAASNIGANVARINYVVNANGASTSSVINYGTASNNLSMQVAGGNATGTSATSLFTTISGLTGGTTYYYTVSATNSGGTVTSSPVSSFTTAVGPTVSAISASGISQSGATINFSVNALGVNSSAYVRYGTSATNLNINTNQTNTITGNSVTALTRVLTGLATGTQYYYQVVAFSVISDTTFSAVQNFTTTAIAVPTLSNVSVSGITSNAATINYTVNANGNNATTIVRYGTSAGNLNLSVAGTNATGSANTPLTVTITSLTANTQYFYSVEATNTGGNATPITGSFTTTAPVSLATISNVTHANITAGTATITYNIAPNASSVQSAIYYGTASNNLNNISDVVTSTSSTSVSHTLRGLNRNTTYYYRVEAANTAGTAQSTVGNFTTANGPAIFNVNVGSLAANSVNINYTINASGNATNTLIRWGLTDNNLNNTVIGQTISANTDVITSLRITGLTPSTTIYYLVEATNSAGSSQSVIQSVSTANPNQTPIITSVQVSNLTASSATIGYFVNINPQFGFGGGSVVNYGTNRNSLNLKSNTQSVSTTANVSHTLTGLTNNTKYYFEIEASNPLASTITAIDSFTIGTVLPLVLNNFSANVAGNNVQLTWQTSQEVNTSHFDVEYSTDGISFKKIDETTAKGSSNSTQYYALKHQLTGNVEAAFYRLKMVDRDGSFTYSNTLKVTPNNSNNFKFSIYPSVTSGSVIGNIVTNAVEKATLHVVNANGQIISKQVVQTANGSTTFNIDMSRYAKGVYVLQVFTSKGLCVQKVIKD